MALPVQFLLSLDSFQYPIFPGIGDPLESTLLIVGQVLKRDT